MASSEKEYRFIRHIYRIENGLQRLSLNEYPGTVDTQDR